MSTVKCPYCGAGFQGRQISSSHINSCQKKRQSGIGSPEVGNFKSNLSKTGNLTENWTPDMINTAFERYNAQVEAERLAEERRPEVERMLASEQEEKRERFERERQEYLDEYNSLPDNDKPVLDQQQIDLLTAGDSQIRNIVYGVPQEKHGEAIVGYLAKSQKLDLSRYEKGMWGGPTKPAQTVTEEVRRRLARIDRDKYMRVLRDPSSGHWL